MPDERAENNADMALGVSPISNRARSINHGKSPATAVFLAVSSVLAFFTMDSVGKVLSGSTLTSADPRYNTLEVVLIKTVVVVFLTAIYVVIV